MVKEDATLPYYGIVLRPSHFELNPGYELVALQLIDAFMQPHGATRLLAIKWRSEDWRVHSGHYGSVANATDNFRVCAGWAADRIMATMAAQRLETAFIATDLRSGSSGTYLIGGAQQEALRTLHERVPHLRNTQMHEFIDAIPDSGVRANVEVGARPMHAVLCGGAHAAGRMSTHRSASLPLAGHHLRKSTNAARHDPSVHRLRPGAALLQDELGVLQVHRAAPEGVPPADGPTLLRRV